MAFTMNELLDAYEWAMGPSSSSPRTRTLRKRRVRPTSPVRTLHFHSPKKRRKSRSKKRPRKSARK